MNNFLHTNPASAFIAAAEQLINSGKQKKSIKYNVKKVIKCRPHVPIKKDSNSFSADSLDSDSVFLAIWDLSTINSERWNV